MIKSVWILLFILTYHDFQLMTFRWPAEQLNIALSTFCIFAFRKMCIRNPLQKSSKIDSSRVKLTRWELIIQVDLLAHETLSQRKIQQQSDFSKLLRFLSFSGFILKLTPVTSRLHKRATHSNWNFSFPCRFSGWMGDVTSQSQNDLLDLKLEQGKLTFMARNVKT